MFVQVILTVRDFESWYRSAHETLYQIAYHPLLVFLSNTFMRNTFLYTVRKLVWIDMFQNRFHDKEFMRKKYEEHIAEVKRSVPSERLLVFEVKQGWLPLCNFLDVPVPSVPFPNANDAASFKAGIRKLNIVASLAASVLVAGIAAGVWALSARLR
eukprot:TRINITY_DN15392_c0_g1_i2.p1 TRINITY_DN15392_c0_g1~~TRINITY_DN15392_c0_g1_i2.p1  ORF type:complete len:156 (+),score=30.44 TRINITY_DN15392_c0_g1_i2:190-657(+)